GEILDTILLEMPPNGRQGADRSAVFVSYSHQDEGWKDLVVGHLQVLQGEGVLDLWDDHRIDAGDAWWEEIEAARTPEILSALEVEPRPPPGLPPSPSALPPRGKRGTGG